MISEHKTQSYSNPSIPTRIFRYAGSKCLHNKLTSIFPAARHTKIDDLWSELMQLLINCVAQLTPTEILACI
jgi:hypothetical protein